MGIGPTRVAELDRLDRQLQSARTATVKLFREFMESAGERLSVLRRSGKMSRIDILVEAGAHTDAALALIDLEMPSWKVRRLLYNDGQWLCSLSRRPGIPAEFDDMAEAIHSTASLAILRAALEARRTIEAAPIFNLRDVPIDWNQSFCCDNFS
jgi:hypothetical protein